MLRMFAAVALSVGCALCCAVSAEEPKKEAVKKGTITGVVTAKAANWIEVKADGEEKGRRYIPHWRGGNPADGGGPDKAMIATLKDVPLKARVRLEWIYEEHYRVEKVEVLKKEKE